MRWEVLQKRRDHDISLVGAAAFVTLTVVTLTALPLQPATAQGPCTAITDDDERLACYDRALRGPVAPAPQTAPAPAAAPAQTRPQPAPAPTRAAAPAATPATPTVATESRRERRIRESAAPPAPAAPTAGNADDDADIIPIVVVSVRTLQGRETTFTASDGTNWVQTDSQRIVGLPTAPFDAEIKPGVIGSSFLLPEGHARAIRVRPVR